MQLPAWASPNHPIARREFNLWRRIFRRWAWAGLFLALLPFACTGLFTLAGLPLAATAGSPGLTLAALAGWGFLSMLWSTSGLLSWALGTFASISAAITVARERETHNWAMLRLTAMPVREIIGAKFAALARLMLWPTVITAGIALVALLITGVAMVGVVMLVSGGTTAQDFPPEMQVGLVAAIIVGVPIAALYTIAAVPISLMYNGAVGLLTSTLTRTTSSAVILSFVVHFGLLMFVIVPVQQVVAIAVQLLSGVIASVTLSPVAVLVVSPLVSSILPILLQLALGLAVFVFAIHQAQKIVE